MSFDPKSNYYDIGGIETIKIIEAKLSQSQLSPFANNLLGNIIKYVCRLPYKGCSLRDAEKIEKYAGMLKEKISTEANDGGIFEEG